MVKRSGSSPLVSPALSRLDSCPTRAETDPMTSMKTKNDPLNAHACASQGDALQIGRTKSSAVYIKDPAVSQKHARLEWTGSKYTITDLGSSINLDGEMATRAQVVYISWFIASTMDDL